MKKMMIALALLCTLALAACSADGAADAATPTPAATASPEPTAEPTATPLIPPVDESLPPVADLQSVPLADLPPRARLAYEHAAGLPVQALGELATGEGFALYLLKNLGDRALPGFVLDADGRVRPDRPAAQDTGEGMTIRQSAASPEDALAEAAASWEDDGFILSERDSIQVWNEAEGAGHLPILYEGSWMRLECADPRVIRLFALTSGDTTWLVTMATYEPIDNPPMLQYLSCMLAGLRFG